MPRRIDPKTRAAYTAAGWGMTDTGRAIAPIRMLSPSYVAPPGFSRLPAPNRRWGGDRANKPAPEVPRIVSSISAIPSGLALAYDSTAAGFHRNIIGDALSDYRTQKARDQYAEPLIRRCTMTRDQYATLQSLATSGQERENFRRAAATGRPTPRSMING